MYQFPVVIESPYNLSGVYPPVQGYVKKIIDCLPVYIEKVIVFGSAVSLRWGQESDLDLLLVTEQPVEDVLHDLSVSLRNIDISIDLVIKNKRELAQNEALSENSLGSEIEREGVCVYERSISSC